MDPYFGYLLHFIPSTIEKVQSEEHLAAYDFIKTAVDYSSVNNPLGLLNYHHFLNYFIDFQNNNFCLEPKIASNVASFAGFS